jgi:hypothetical protein
VVTARGQGAWRENAWLLLLGLFALVAPLALGPERFRVLLGFVPDDGPLETRLGSIPTILRVVVPLGGGLALAAYLAAGLARRSVLGFAFGPLARGERWLALVLALALIDATLFVAVRAARDVERAWSWRGIPLRERAFRAYDQGRFVPSLADEFLQLARSRGGNLLILRGSGEGGELGGFLRLEHLQYSAHLFPVRVFLARAPRCSVADLPEAWLAERGIRWVIRDCEARFVFAPAPLARGEAR